MNRVRRKTSLVVTAGLLIFSGVGVGAFASSFVTDATHFQRRPLHAAAWPTTEAVAPDHAEAGRAWARSAFVGGLRKCPEMNASFVAACREEIAALMKRPEMTPGSYGGPLLVTSIEAEPPAPPEPAPEPPAEQPAEPAYDAPTIG